MTVECQLKPSRHVNLIVAPCNFGSITSIYQPKNSTYNFT